MPTKQSKKATKGEGLDLPFEEIWGVSDTYSNMGISSVDVFSIHSLQKVATLKISN